MERLPHISMDVNNKCDYFEDRLKEKYKIDVIKREIKHRNLKNRFEKEQKKYVYDEKILKKDDTEIQIMNLSIVFFV
jgi:ribonucleotide reductase alpha subunit